MDKGTLETILEWMDDCDSIHDLRTKIELSLEDTETEIDTPREVFEEVLRKHVVLSELRDVYRQKYKRKC